MKVNRRSFLKSVFGAGKYNTWSEEPVLVVVFLRGGADTLNMVIPFGDDDYYRARPTIGIRAKSKTDADRDKALRLDDFYAFHPRLKPWLPIFKEGRLAVVQAVGSDNVSGSHFEAQDQMEHGESFHQNLDGGWLGRHLFYDVSRNVQNSPVAAVAFGNTIPESLRGAPSVSAIQSLDDIRLMSGEKSTDDAMAALSCLYGHSSDMLGKAGLDTLSVLKRIESEKSSSRALANLGHGTGSYPEDELGRNLREVARLIKANLGLKVACVDHDGWDTHFVQGGADGLQAANIDSLARSLAAFDGDVKGLRHRVTTVVLTEFGRRSYENSSLGTDHGRGFAMFVLSDKVKGGQVTGAWPGLKERNANLLGSEKVLRRLPLKDLEVLERKTPYLGPAGLTVAIDYRDVLFEILNSVIGNENADKVFPGLEPQKLNLVRA